MMKKSPSTISVKSAKLLWSRPWFRVVVVALGALLVGAGVWLVYSSLSQNDGQPVTDVPARSTACTIEDVEKYNAAMNPQNIAELTSVADAIRDRDNYQGDINCLYILIRERIAAGDDAAAEQLFTTLKQLSSSNIELSGKFSPRALDYSVIRATIDSTREQNSREPLSIWEETE